MDTNMMLWAAIAVFLTIGIIVGATVKSTDTDKVKGDKRLVATVFIMSSFIFLGVKWALGNCAKGIRRVSRAFGESV
jgi:hypothetical protein